MLNFNVNVKNKHVVCVCFRSSFLLIHGVIIWTVLSPPEGDSNAPYTTSHEEDGTGSEVKKRWRRPMWTHGGQLHRETRDKY